MRILHSPRPDVPGTSMHLQQTDPWHAYQRGRSYFFREWSVEDGVFAALAKREVAAATTSCGMCHNLPFRTPGAGGNTVQPVGYGLNTPHLFGAGLVEMIGMQAGALILAAYDQNRNGFLDVPAETAGRRALVEAAPGSIVDFGALDDLDGNGLPDLNRVVQFRLVDGNGQARPAGPEGKPSRLGDPGIAGYHLSVALFATTRSDHQFSTLRTFTNGALRTVMGMVPDDPTSFQQLGPRQASYADSVWAEVSNAGAPQPNLNLQPESLAAIAALQGSKAGTLSEGEIDLLEWFLLNHPAPAQAAQTGETRRGRLLLDRFGCTSCHTPDWVLHPHDAERGLAGDRRFFDLAVAPDPATGRLEGRLRPLLKEVPGPGGAVLRVPRREGFAVRGVFADFLHHDLGERFHEHYYWNGRTQILKHFRTAPLWGVGSTAPYGHDGRSMTLDDVIRRHGGEAEAAAKAYGAAPSEDREALIAFLQTLVLYQPDLLPTDLDGDSRIAADVRVSGRSLGPERFSPELLFRVTPVYRGWIEDPEGDRYFSYEMLNQAEAYGEELEALTDRDRNGTPDLEERKAPSASVGALSGPRAP
ncbi:MAG TPA: di-heme oxidoredictase family protein [Thermoanaerobaculia bacterium]|nr:di-heme oxidoredictase family protein [Thermoanaerobaculia bacterium]